MLSVGLEKVKADAGQIEQILMNLVVNARDAMPTAGRLTIETSNVDLDAQYAKTHPGSSAGPHVMIAVTDTGTGMTPEVQKRLFEPFFTTKGQGKGTGLGLASVYGVVKQNAGYIAVSSEVGHGTTFTIFWPTTTDVAPAVEEKLEGHASGAEKILVVEDNEGVRSLVCWALTQRGYVVTSAVDAPDALRVAEDMPQIDLLLTDIIMPGMSGHALATELAIRRPGITVLFMSGYTDDTVLRHGVEMGTAFLQKPFTARSLGHKVRHVLDDAALARSKKELA